jgi:hypothetical protein
MDPAVQNQPDIRQLIMDIRNAALPIEEERLRMIQGLGVGTDSMTNKQGER